MKSENISRIKTRFDGYGDSGQMEEWEIETADGTTTYGPHQLPKVMVERTAVSWTGETESSVLPLSEAVEAFCYDLLAHHQPGWEINDGSFGEFVFDVFDWTIALEHNQRFTDSIQTMTEL